MSAYKPSIPARILVAVTLGVILLRAVNPSVMTDWAMVIMGPVAVIGLLVDVLRHRKGQRP